MIWREGEWKAEGGQDQRRLGYPAAKVQCHIHHSSTDGEGEVETCDGEGTDGKVLWSLLLTFLSSSPLLHFPT